MNKIIKYPSGLRLVLHSLKNTRSMAIGLYVGTGSACETATNNGISHFIEHMLFKGTKNRSAFNIAEDMESIGAQINAFTSREMISFFTISTDEHTEKCFDVLSDMFFNATLTEENIQKEKGVILEEISMCEDDPTDLVMTLLSEAYFGNSGLGRSILGTPDTVNSLDANTLREYMAGLYTADNLVLAVAGNINFDAVNALVKKYFEQKLSKIKKKAIVCEPPDIRPRSLSKIKPIEQSNIAFAFPSYKYDDRISLSVALLSNVLGGGMSSRLFQKLREELSL
ncbi:MAG: pitrilysin family protein, partial [Clostridia bacterium]